MTSHDQSPFGSYRRALPASAFPVRQVTITRRVAVGGLVAAVGLTRAVRVPHAQAAPQAEAKGSPWARRAVASLDALVKQFRDPATGLYLETVPKTGDNPWSYAWPFSQATIASQDVAGIPGTSRDHARLVAQNYRVLEGYWNADSNPPGYDSYLRPPQGQGGDKFYDDNEWIALGLIQRHLMSPKGDSAALRGAAQIFRLIVHGWDTDASHPCPGGVFWTQASWSNDRNTVSNAPGAEVGLHLYLQTGQRSYLDWALRMYQWCRQWMLAPNGLYWDHVDLKGQIEKTQWSYNQGVMIGAGTLLYRATGRRTYLDQAVETAHKALDHYDGDGWLSQPAEFNAIFFANLLQLDRVRHDPAYVRTYVQHLESLEQFLDPETGLYLLRGKDPVTLLNQAGVVRMQAMAAWPRGKWSQLT